jgi:hypothetical protein
MNADKILNTGLHYAMEFGEKWLEPIRDRLLKKFPELTKEELDHYNKVCQTVMEVGHKFVYRQLEAADDKDESIIRGRIRKA